MQTGPPQPSATSILFARGVIARLSLWTALRVAVLEGWGGPESSQKRTWVASVIVDSFEDASTPSDKPDVQYIEEMLLQIMADEFETNIEDGSAEEVAKDIVHLWDVIQSESGASSGSGSRGMDIVSKLEEQAEKEKGKKPAIQQSAGSDDDWEDDDEGGSGSDEEEGDEEGIDGDEAPQLIDHRSKYEPEVDDEGFTLIKGKGKSHR